MRRELYAAISRQHEIFSKITDAYGSNCDRDPSNESVV